MDYTGTCNRTPVLNVSFGPIAKKILLGLNEGDDLMSVTPKCEMFLESPWADQTSNVEEIGNPGKVGKVGKAGKVGKVGNIGKVGKEGKWEKVGNNSKWLIRGDQRCP